VLWEQGDLRLVAVGAGELVISVHACGLLTDRTLDAALAVRAAVAVLPCCHNVRLGETAGLEAWMDGALAVDTMRALRLRSAGYRISLLTIPEDITPQNRLLVGVPEASPQEGDEACGLYGDEPHAGETSSATGSDVRVQPAVDR
jgi:hypothetical protein